uniref:F-box domain-containing protein n=1 Tax=Musa acuminata subsp. malaccensis TaxID=214687 RepID=A0A804JQ88_MUSAM|nr:PREDICTED: putative F-box protein PP2-B12 [Musa acuminata subsp. malaccensis]
MGESGMDRLPEGCVAHAIALTSPRDVCRFSAVSSAFRSAAAYDTVWDRFLPSDYRSILSRAVRPVVCSSKRDLFFRLCDSLLIDAGKMSFWLERSSGAKCYMLSARSLSITWGDTPQYWRWVPLSDCRFSEAAELVNVCWLEIRGKIQSRMLSGRTTYAAYLIFRLADWSRGLGHPPQEASVTMGVQHSSTHVVRLQPNDSPSRVRARRNRIRFGPLVRWGAMMLEIAADQEAAAEEVGDARDDGWMEAELGELYIDEGEDGEVEMSLMEVRGGHWKKGLIIQGIEIRPKA